MRFLQPRSRAQQLSKAHAKLVQSITGDEKHPVTSASSSNSGLALMWKSIHNMLGKTQELLWFCGRMFFLLRSALLFAVARLVVASGAWACLVLQFGACACMRVCCLSSAVGVLFLLGRGGAWQFCC